VTAATALSASASASASPTAHPTRTNHAPTRHNNNNSGPPGADSSPKILKDWQGKF